MKNLTNKFIPQYDTKEMKIATINNKVVEYKSIFQDQITQQKFSSKFDVEKFLFNVYNKLNSFNPLIFIANIKNETDLFFLQGKESIDAFNLFLNDEIEISFLKPLKEGNKVVFSNLSSSDRRKFEIYYFRVILIYDVEKIEDLESIKNNILF